MERHNYMKYIFTFLSCLICGLVCAETIQHVEYQLPKAAENWVVGNKLESKQGTTLIYIPQGVERQNTEEFFGVNANNLPTHPNDSEAIKLSLTKMFPSMNIDLRVLEMDKNSIMYEWSAQENGVEKIHGWGRAFSNQDGSVVLEYQTKNISKIQQARSVWLQALKDAKQQVHP